MARKTGEKNKKRNTKDKTTLDLDKEIIIGIKTLPEEAPKKAKKQQTKKTKGKTNYNKKSKSKKNVKKNKSSQDEIEFDLKLGIKDEEIKKKKPKKKTAREQEIARKKRKIAFRVIKYTTLVAILIGGGIYFLLSPFFNVNKISVVGNEKITKEEIISLSSINLNENTFKIQGLYRKSIYKKKITK